MLETRVLRGPNVWVKKPVIRMSVDLGVLEQYPSNTIPGFNEALMALLPTMEEHACSLGRRGGFFSRLADGTWMGHVAEHIALELQCLAGTEVRIGKTRSSGSTGRYEVIFEYREEQVGLEAGRIAVALVNFLVAPDDPDDVPRPAGCPGAAHPDRGAVGVRARPRRPSSMRRCRATSPGSGSTGTAWCSSARASTSSASGPR